MQVLSNLLDDSNDIGLQLQVSQDFDLTGSKV
jgi:hypothetical protein